MTTDNLIALGALAASLLALAVSIYAVIQSRRSASAAQGELKPVFHCHPYLNSMTKSIDLNIRMENSDRRTLIVDQIILSSTADVAFAEFTQIRDIVDAMTLNKGGQTHFPLSLELLGQPPNSSVASSYTKQIHLFNRSQREDLVSCKVDVEIEHHFSGKRRKTFRQSVPITLGWSKPDATS